MVPAAPSFPLDTATAQPHITAMKVSEADILIIPGHGNSGPQHWQTRWQEKLSTARRVEQDDWMTPALGDWTCRIIEAVEAATKPVVLVAHSLGVAAVVHAAPQFGQRIAGAFLAAPPDLTPSDLLPQELAAFGPYPRDPLPFPSITIASRSDPFGTYDHAEDITNAWGSLLIDAGDSGHLNTASGHGPWPEGSMVFAQFLSRLQV